MAESASYEPKLDFETYVDERTAQFSGRRWVFDEVAAWLNDPAAERCFAIVGEPGAGKTALGGRLWQLSRGVSRAGPLGPSFLSAVHFCSATNSAWVSPYSFLASMAHQLQRFEPYARALVEQRAGPVRMDISMHAERVEGQQIGIYIRSFSLSEAVPLEDVFVSLVRAPLDALLRSQPATRVVLLVDALDEALEYGGGSGAKTIVSLLGEAASLPPGVRLIVSTRPQHRVLRWLPNARLCELVRGEGRARSHADIERFTREHVLPGQPRASRGDDLADDELVRLIVDRSDGNFLYVHYLARMLTEAEGPVTRAMLKELPTGLDGVYLNHLERLTGRDLEAWESLYGLLLGTLAVAKVPLEARQLAFLLDRDEPAVRLAVARSLPLLDIDDEGSTPPRYSLYHRSFADFVLDGQRACEYWLEPAAQHRRIVGRYRGGARTWPEVDWSKVDDYGLDHLAQHLADLAGTSGSRTDLFALICEQFMRRKQDARGSHESFATDVALALRAASESSPPDLGEEARHTLLYATLAEVSGEAPPDSLAILAANGRDDLALGYAALVADPAKRAEAYARIGGRLSPSAAIDVLRWAEDLVEFIDDLDERLHVLLAMVDGHLATGAAERAADLLRAAEALAADLRHDDQWRPTRSAVVAAVYEHEGVDGLIGVLRRHESPRLVIAALWRLLEVPTDVRLPAPMVEEVVERTRQIAESSDRYRAQALALRAAALLRAGRASEAAEWFRGWLDVAAEDDDARFDNGWLLGALGRSFACYGETALALATLGKLVEWEVDVKHAASVAAALDAAGASEAAALAWQSCRGLADALEDAGNRARGLAEIARGQAGSGRSAAAIETARAAMAAAAAFDEPRFRTAERGAAASALARVGLIDETRAALASIADAGARDSQRWGVCESLIAARELDAARSVADEALGNSSRSRLLLLVVNAMAAAGRAEDAAQVSRRIPEPRWRAQGLTAAAAAIDRGGGSGSTLAREAIAASETVVATERKVETLCALTRALHASGDTDGAQRAVSSAHAAALEILDERKRARSLATLAGALHAVADRRAVTVDEEAAAADALANEVAWGAPPEPEYVWVIDAARRGHRAWAMEQAQRLPDWQKARAFAGIAVAMVEQGHGADAADPAARAAASAQQLDEPQQRMDALAAAATAYAHVGHTQRVEELAIALEQTAANTPSPENRAWMLGEAAAALSLCGSLDRSLQFYRASLDAARSAGRDGVLRSIGDGAGALAAAGGSTLLRQIHAAIDAIDTWWHSPSAAAVGSQPAPGTLSPKRPGSGAVPEAPV